MDGLCKETKGYVIVGSVGQLERVITNDQLDGHVLNIAVIRSPEPYIFGNAIVIKDKQQVRIVSMESEEIEEKPIFLSPNPLFKVEGGNLEMINIRLCVNAPPCEIDSPKTDNGTVECHGGNVKCTQCEFSSTCGNGAVVTCNSKALFKNCKFEAHADGLTVIQSNATCLCCEFSFSSRDHISAYNSVMYLDECKLGNFRKLAIRARMEFDDCSHFKVFKSEFKDPRIEIEIFHKTHAECFRAIDWDVSHAKVQFGNNTEY